MSGVRFHLQNQLESDDVGHLVWGDAALLRLHHVHRRDDSCGIQSG